MYEALLQDASLLEQAAEVDIRIDRDGPLDLYTQPQNYFKWSALAGIAESRANRQRCRVKEELWPLAREQARMNLQARGEKVTESKVDDVACVNASYRAGQNLLVDLEAAAAVMRSAERAMAQRMEMLRSLNSRQKVELGGYQNDDLEREAKANLTKTRNAKKL